MPDRTRQCYFHGIVFMLVSCVLGLVTGMTAGKPEAVLWLASHLTVLLSSVFIIVVGVVWRHLSLSPRQAKVAYAGLVLSNYVLVPPMNILLPALGYPSIILTPDLPTAPAWMDVLAMGFAIPSMFITFAGLGLLLYGLRGKAAADPT